MNLPYLRPDRVHWIGVEPNPFMQSYISEEATKLGMLVEIRIGTADKLPVSDSSVDAVISTLVLCVSATGTAATTIICLRVWPNAIIFLPD